MATGQGPKTSLVPILEQIEVALAAALDLSAGRILYSRIDDTPRFGGDQDVVLRVGGARPYGEMYSGEGIIAPAVMRPIYVQLRTRSASDVSDRVDIWLKQKQLIGEEKITLAMLGLRPYDNTDALDPITYLIEEIYLLNVGEFHDEIRRIPNTDKTWGGSVLAFGLNYCMIAPDLPEQAE